MKIHVARYNAALISFLKLFCDFDENTRASLELLDISELLHIFGLSNTFRSQIFSSPSMHPL